MSYLDVFDFDFGGREEWEMMMGEEGKGKE